MQQDRPATGTSFNEPGDGPGAHVEHRRPPGRRRSTSTEQAARQMRAILDASPNAILLVDLEGRILFANEQVSRALGYRPEALAGQLVELLVPDGSRSAHVAMRDAFVQGGHDRAFGVRTNLYARRADGSTFAADVALGLIDLDDGPGVVVNVIDVEARQQLEARLLQAQKMELMGRFANILAHDMRNYLNAIAGLADLAGQTVDAAVLDEELRMIGQVVRRADQAITNILGIGRPHGDSGSGTNVPEFLVATRRVFEQLAHPQCSVDVEAPNVLPDVAMDAGALSQILMNLVTNARDAMPGGGRIIIGARASTVAAPAGSSERHPEPVVVVSVRDTGIGMDETTRARIFEPFFSTKRSGESGSGSGLGLASVEMLVSRAHGTIRVDSAEGRGSCFEVVLPVAVGAPA